jgi:hypothetical protein
MKNLGQVAVLFLLAIQAVLVPVQIATLLKLLKGGNNKKAMQTTLWFLISNIVYIIGFFFLLAFKKGQETRFVLLSLNGFCQGIFVFLQSEAHFEFSFNYLNVVITIPYALEFKQLPAETKILIMIYLWMWRAANLIISLLMAFYLSIIGKASIV